MPDFAVTYALIAVTALLSYICFDNRDLYHRLAHSPYDERHRGEYYRLITSGFIHKDWNHLLINMLVLYFFGRFAEAAAAGGGSLGFGPTLGPLVYLGLYLATIVVAGLPTLISHGDDPGYRAIGASGGVSGATTLFAVFNPWQYIYLYFLLPIPAIVAAVAYVLYSHWADGRRADGIGHSAHLYGALAMPALYLLFRPRLASHFVAALTQNFPL